MNKKPLPKIKRSQDVQTVITFEAEESLDDLLKSLEEEIAPSDDKYPANEEEIIKIEASDLINYVLDRVSYISDPKPEQKISTNNIEIETIIKYNYYLKRFMNEIATQTSLSLESKASNSALIDDYLETKKLVKNYLEECLDTGVYSRIMIDDFVEEIIDKSSEIVRQPMKSEAIQTVASCQYDNLKDDEILTKLRVSVDIDPFESSIAVLPILNDILKNVSEEVRSNGNKVAKFIVDKLMGRVDGITKKLMEIRRETEVPSVEEKLNLRRKKLAALMPKKKVMEDALIQTEFSGVPEIKKLKQVHRVVCDTCPEESSCQWCSSDDKVDEKINQKTKKVGVKKKKKLGTRDILLAYKPCYIVVDPDEVTSDMKPPCPTESRDYNDEMTGYNEEYGKNSSDEISNYSCQSTRQVTQKSRYATGSRKSQYAGSTSGWSNLIREETADLWHSGASGNSKNHGVKKTLEKEKIMALEVLKSTFCSQKNCSGLSGYSSNDNSSQDEAPVVENKNPKRMNFCQGFDDTSESDECDCSATRNKNKPNIIQIQMQFERKK